MIPARFTPIAALSLALAACGPARFDLVRQRDAVVPIEIRQLHLAWSNLYLVRRGASALLVDAGSPGDWDGLRQALRAVGLAPGALAIVVLTHGHADHVGLASRLRAAGVPVAMGRGDAEMARSGRNAPLRATGPAGTLLRPFVDFEHPRFVPDVWVDTAIDLGAYGFPEVRIEPMAGHTPGSLVVWVGARDVIAGDTVLGGTLGGGTSASEHFYQTDPRANHCNVDRLLTRGAQRFYVGHGGPIDRASVLEWRRSWSRELPASCHGAPAIESPR